MKRFLRLLEFFFGVKGQFAIWGVVFLVMDIFETWDKFIMYMILGVFIIGPREFTKHMVAIRELKKVEK